MDQNKVLTDKLKARMGEILFRITELETILEIKESEIKGLNDLIKKLQNSLETDNA